MGFLTICGNVINTLPFQTNISIMYTSKSYESTKVVDYKLLRITSEAFSQVQHMPSVYTCEGENINPPIHIEHIPLEAKTLAIIVDDPDAPGGSFCHWVTWNIPVTHAIKEGEHRGATGMNDYSQHRYNGPCPPSGTHRYYFKIYALDCSLDIPVSSDKKDLESAMCDHVIGFGILVGSYKKKNG
jgi:Raf kinase inhibitor-like YbhB/YbcL family protein